MQFKTRILRPLSSLEIRMRSNAALTRGWTSVSCSSFLHHTQAWAVSIRKSGRFSALAFAKAAA